MRNESFEDDGRVLADMSGVERRALFLPRFRSRSGGQTEPAPGQDLPREDRSPAVRGALTASLLIAGVFAGGMAIIIALLQLVWNAA